MSDKVFKELRVRYQIPEHIPIRLPKENEKCYSGRTADVGMYDAMFAVELRLPLTTLHHQLVDYLGLSVSQIAPNAWRTFIGAKILWGSLSGGNPSTYAGRVLLLLQTSSHILFQRDVLLFRQGKRLKVGV